MQEASSAKDSFWPDDDDEPSTKTGGDTFTFSPPSRGSPVAATAQDAPEASAVDGEKTGSIEGADQAAPIHLESGMSVRLKGLKAKPELNGKIGRLKEFVEEKGRWTVQINGTDSLLKEDNLELAPVSAEPDVGADASQSPQALVPKRRPLPTTQLSPEEAVDWVNSAADEFEMLLLPLELEEDPSKIRKQFRQMSLLVHPDKNTHPDANAAFRKLFGAMETLSEPMDQRVALRKAKTKAGGKDNGPTTGEHWWQQASVDEMEKAFREMEAKMQKMGFFDADRTWMSFAQGVNEDSLWITVEAAKNLLDKDLALFFDARNTTDFDVSHVEGARSMPGHTMGQLASIEKTAAFKEAARNPEQTMVVYSDNGSQLSRCVYVARALRMRLPKWQAVRVLRLTGGLNLWKRHGFPVKGDTRALFAGKVLGNSMMRVGQ